MGIIELAVKVLEGDIILTEDQKEELKKTLEGFEDALKLSEILKKQESAFKKIFRVDKNAAEGSWNYEINEARKEGWNAAIDAVLQTGIIAPSVEYVKPWFDKIRKLRED